MHVGIGGALVTSVFAIVGFADGMLHRPPYIGNVLGRGQQWLQYVLICKNGVRKLAIDTILDSLEHAGAFKDPVVGNRRRRAGHLQSGGLEHAIAETFRRRFARIPGLSACLPLPLW